MGNCSTVLVRIVEDVSMSDINGVAAIVLKYNNKYNFLSDTDKKRLDEMITVLAASHTKSIVTL